MDEAIRWLEKQRPAGALVLSRGMSLAARDLAAPQGASGGFGHTGPDGSSPSDRIERHGRWESLIGENVAYGQRSARDVVAAFIVDDGVPGRGHRKNLFNPAYRVMGVDCAPHAVYGTTCAVTFAAASGKKQSEGPHAAKRRLRKKERGSRPLSMPWHRAWEGNETLPPPCIPQLDVKRGRGSRDPFRSSRLNLRVISSSSLHRCPRDRSRGAGVTSARERRRERGYP